MSKILAPFLGTALALAPQVAHAREAVHKPLETLSAQTLSEVTLVVNNTSIAQACNPAWEQSARRYGYDVYRDATERCYAWKGEYKFAEINGAVGVILRPDVAELDPNSCISARTYVGEFTINGQRHLVIESDDIETNLVCPEKEDTTTPTSSVLPIQPVYTDPDDKIPEASGFGVLDPKLLETGKFLKPLKLGLKESQLDAKLDNPRNLLHRGSAGVDVYARYEMVEYDSKRGRMVLRLVGAKRGQTCDIAIKYEDTFIEDSQRYFVIPDDFQTSHKPCEEAVLHAAPVHAEGSVTSADNTAPKPGVRAALLAGLEIDELVDTPGFGPSAEVAAMVTVKPFPNQFSAGVMTDIIISPSGSGFEGLNGMVGSQGNILGIYGLAGVASEPRWSREDDPTTPEVEKDPFDGVLAAGALVTVDLPLKGPLGATCGVSGELVWGGGNFPLNVGVLCGGTFDFDLNRDKQAAAITTDTAQKPVPVEPSPTPVKQEAAARVEAPEAIEASDIEYTRIPYVLEPRDSDALSETEEAERVRIGEENEKLASNNKWPAVEAGCDKMFDFNGALQYGDYYLCAQAAAALGDIKGTYERLIWAYDVQKTKEVSDWLKKIELNYSYVDIWVKGLPGVELIVPNPPFAPDARASIVFMMTDYEGDQHATGFLPITDNGAGVIEYTLGGVKLDLKPLSLGQVQEKKTPGQSLKDEKPYYVSKSADRSKTQIVLEQ